MSTARLRRATYEGAPTRARRLGPQTRMGAGIAANPHCPRPVRRAGEGLASYLGAGSGRGLSASVGSLSGSSAGTEAPSRFPGLPVEANFYGSLLGRRRSKLRRSPRSAPRASSGGFPIGSNWSELRLVPTGSRRSELRRVPFAVPPSEDFGPAGRFEESGVGSGFHLRLALLPLRTRPSRLPRHSRRFAASASGPLPSIRISVSGKADLRLPSDIGRANRFAPEQSGSICLWITGISGIESGFRRGFPSTERFGVRKGPRGSVPPAGLSLVPRDAG
jgi:hypothetical protein